MFKYKQVVVTITSSLILIVIFISILFKYEISFFNKPWYFEAIIFFVILGISGIIGEIIDKIILTKYKKNKKDVDCYNYSTYISGVLVMSLSNLIPTVWSISIQFILIIINGLCLLWCFRLIFRILIEKQFDRFVVIKSAMLLYVASGLFFSGVYYRIPNSLNKASSFIDFIYFSFITLSTTGFGDIHPQGELAKLVVILENIIGLILVAIILSGATDIPNKIRKKTTRANKGFH